MRLTSIALALAASLGPGPGPPGPDDGFEAAQRDGVVVWSRLDRDRFRLVVRRGGGAPRFLPVAPSRTPFQVEVGRDRAGRLVVAFARCDAEDEGDAVLLERRRCRLGLVGVDGVAERSLGPTPARGVSHVRPALAGGRLAYVRVADRGGRAEVVVDGAVAYERGGLSGPRDVLGLDVADFGLAVMLREVEDSGATLLVLKRPGARAQVVAAGQGGEENDQQLVTPSFSGPHLVWGFANHGPYVETKRSYVFRRRLATGATTGHRLSPYVTSVATDAARPDTSLVVTTDDALDSPEVVTGRQAVRRLARPGFRPVPSDDLVYP
jgi:hypothetical protein